MTAKKGSIEGQRKFRMLRQTNLWIFCVADGRWQSLADGLPPARPLPLGASLHVLDGLFHKEAAERHGRLRGVDATLEPGAFCDEGQREHAAKRWEEDFMIDVVT